MVEQTELLKYLNHLLSASQFKDYAPNGLQVAGAKHIKRLMAGVTASEALIDLAIDWQADALFVHHGYFWKGEDPTVVGMKRRRLKKLLTNDINLYAYHLPLDAHSTLGNNAQLAIKLDIEQIAVMAAPELQGVGNVGKLKSPVSAQEFQQHIASVLEHEVVYVSGGEHLIQRVAYCTGGAQSYLLQAAAEGVDAYISGEISEKTTHEAREMGVHYFAAGHHATERYGAMAVANHLHAEFGLETCFQDIPNPA